MVVSPSGEPVPLYPDVGDDATPHLLLGTSAAHLVPPGIEQVVETEAGTICAFTRERSTLTRAERIGHTRAKREGVAEHEQPGGGATGEARTVGTGEKVVQKLKDVI